MTEGGPPEVKPLDPPMVPFAVAGIVAWVIAFVVLWAVGGRDEWLWICVAGFLWGFPGLFVMLRHDAHRRRRLQA